MLRGPDGAGSAVSVAQYAAGVVLLLVTTGSFLLAARFATDRLLPAWSGPPGWLATIVAAFALLFAWAQLLGTVGLLTRAGLSVAAGATAAAALVWRRRASPSTDTVPTEHEPSPRPVVVLAFVAVAVLAAQWSTRVLRAVDRGTGGLDALVYHLPFAARFAQDGRITALHFTIPDLPTQFVPANAELVHTVGILYLRHDFLSPFVNAGWAALTLLAAYCVGRQRGLGAAAAIAACVILASPLMVETQAGTGLVDVPPLFFVLAAVALLLHDDGSWPVVALAGAAAGMGVAAKATLLLPAVALTVAVVLLAPRVRRRATAGAWLGAIGATAAFWYARNLAVVGNPLPGFRPSFLGFTLPGPRSAVVEAQDASVLHYIADTGIWSDYFVPGFRQALGPGWPLLLAACAAGILAALVSGNRRVRIVGVLAAVGVATWVVVPVGAGGPEGMPYLFAANVRWLTAPLAVGLVMLPRARWLQGGRRPLVVAGLLAAMLLSMQTATAPWPSWGPEHRRAALAVGLAVAAAAVALRWWAGRRVDLGMPAAAVAALGALLAGAVGGFFVGRHSLAGRYVDEGTPRAPIYEWARGVSGARIAVGGFPQVYPVYGLDLSNHVQYIGHEVAHHGFVDTLDCREWRTEINDGGYDYAVTAPIGGRPLEPKQAAWTRTDPNATEVLTVGAAAVFRIDGPLDPDACPP